MRISDWQVLVPRELKRQLAEFERYVRSLLDRLRTADDTLTFAQNGLSRSAITGDVLVPAGSNVSTIDPKMTLSFAHIYEDFISRPVSSTAAVNDVTIGSVTFANVSSGTWSHLTSALPSEHPGIIRFGLPATIGAASGVNCAKHVSHGGDWLWVCFRTASAFANLTAKIGLINTSMAAEPVDGVYLWQTPGTSTFGFKSANSSTRTTGATATLSANTWYTLGLRMNDARNSCSCLLLNDNGAVVLSYNLTTNLPTTSAALEVHASVRTTAASAVAQALDLDLIRVRLGSVGAPLGRPFPPGEWSL